MPVDERCRMYPPGFEADVKDAPQDPQMAYKASEPLVRASSTTGTRERDIYPEQAAGLTPKRQGNID